VERADAEERSPSIIGVPPHGLLVSFSGIDGTGKSTAASQLSEMLKREYGLASRYVWCKFGDHPFSRYRLSRFVGEHQVSELNPCDTEAKQISPLLWIYGAVLLAFHLIQIIFSIWRPVRRGQVVICDRYIFDTMVDLEQDLHLPRSRVRSIFGARWIPQPDCKFLLDLEEEAAFSRKIDIPSSEYLQARRTRYLGIAREYGLTVVDASQSAEAVTQLVSAQIRANCFHGRGAT
jgi:thymidylate kinase